MPKQLAIVLDASGSMFHPAGGGSDSHKIVEASQSAQYVIDEIVTKVAADSDQWAVSIWRFASSVKALTGQTVFNSTISDFTVSIVKGQIADIENQTSNQAAIGNLTDIFDAVRTVAQYMVDNPPAVGPGPLKKKILLFTDGNQTIEHDGSLTKGGYEFEQGIDFTGLLAGNSIALNAQGIGSDLLNYTLTDLVDDANAFGSSAKIINTTPGYEADVAAALMLNSMKIVNNNGILSLRPKDEPGAGLLWEQFTLPRVVRDEQQTASGKRVNYKEFEVECDSVTRELLLGITWHHPGHPSVQAVSPGGTLFEPGIGGAFKIEQGRLAALHIPSPEPGTWCVRVDGDPSYRPMRLNFMARGVNPKFVLAARAAPWRLEKPDFSTIIATPFWDGKTAEGEFQATATSFTGDMVKLARQADGTYQAKVELKTMGLIPWRVELQGKLVSGETVHRIEFTAVQVGRPRDPRLVVTPDQYEAGRKYTVDVRLIDAEFDRLSQIRFGDGIDLKQFVVQSTEAARAVIEVSGSAEPGRREVVSFHPEAETLSGITILPGCASAPSLSGMIQGLRFDAAGQLDGIVLDSNQAISVIVPAKQLQHLLETARDTHQKVTIEVDVENRLTGVLVVT